MIDWTGVGVSALWILGLALLLASFSAARYGAGTGAAMGYRLGMGLFVLGMWAGSTIWWQQVGWMVVAALWGLELISGLLRGPRRRRSRP